MRALLGRWLPKTLILTLPTLGACGSVKPDEQFLQQEGSKALAKGCRPLRYSTGVISIRAFVEGSGDVCLLHDLKQRNLVDPHDNSNPGSPSEKGVLAFVTGGTRNVSVDLQEHLVTGAPFNDTFGVTIESSDRHDPINLQIKNGRIVTPGRYAVAVMLGSASYQSCGRNIPGCAPANEDGVRKRRTVFNPQTKTMDLVDWKDLPESLFTLEALHIQSGGRAVLMSGAGNTIRNSTFEVDGHTAVYLYGAKQVIENNTFIVHLKPGHEGDLPAMLKLRDAHGAVIRNNRFIVKGGLFAGKAEAAINLLESTDVLIEGNTVEGAKTLVRKDVASTTVERGNTLN